MPTHRDTHYSLLFIFLGVIAALGSLFAPAAGQTKGFSSESIWFLAIGAIGVVINHIGNNRGLTVAFDLIVGVILGIAGLVGILLNFNLIKLSSLPSHGLISTSGGVQLAGLSIAFFQSLVYAYFALTSIRHGLEPNAKK